jgi:hypothetical protein
MNTAQESLANSVFPPPCSAENVAQQDRADLPTNKANNNQFANDDQVVERQKGVPTMPLLAHEKVNAYHVPPSRYAPRADAYRHDDTLDLPPETDPLPERCQFMFSDGRQCTMARSDIHPSLCRFHSEREDQLFGDPTAGGKVVGAALDLPELYSACRDLTTAAGVNRALAQVFRLLAQRRISRQEAATFGHLAQLLLRTVSLMSAEAVPASENKQPMTAVVERQKGLAITPLLPHEKVILSSGESHGHQELLPVNKVQRERRISPNPVPEAKISPPSRAIPPHAKEVQPPPNGYVMKADPQQDASSIFCRPGVPVVGEESFVLSGSCLAQSALAKSSSATQVK